jgi:hypothetical protein
MKRRPRTESSDANLSSEASLVGATFTARDVAVMTDGRVNPALLKVWNARGYLKFRTGRQETRERRFEFVHTIQIALIVELASQGLTVDAAAKWAPDIVKRFAAGEGPMFAWSPRARSTHAFPSNVTAIDLIDAFKPLSEGADASVAFVDMISLQRRMEKVAIQVLVRRETSP